MNIKRDLNIGVELEDYEMNNLIMLIWGSLVLIGIGYCLGNLFPIKQKERK